MGQRTPHRGQVRLLRAMAVLVGVFVVMVLCRHIIWNWLVQAADLASAYDRYVLASRLDTLSEYFAYGSPDRLSRSLYGHSIDARLMGDYPKADALLRRRLDILSTAYGADSEEYIVGVIELAGMLQCPGADVEGLIPVLSQTLEISTAKSDHAGNALLLSSLVVAHYLTGNIAKSDAMYERYLQELTYEGNKSKRPIQPYFSLMRIYHKAGDDAAANAVKQRVLQNPRIVKLMYDSEKTYLESR